MLRSVHGRAPCCARGSRTPPVPSTWAARTVSRSRNSRSATTCRCRPGNRISAAMINADRDSPANYRGRYRSSALPGEVRLSAGSRWNRFLMSKKELSPGGIALLHPDRSPRPRGAGRPESRGRARREHRPLYSGPESPQTAEIAVTVVDDWQRRGLATGSCSRRCQAEKRQVSGRRLLTRLLARLVGTGETPKTYVVWLITPEVASSNPAPDTARSEAGIRTRIQPRVAVGGAFDSDTAAGMMPAAQRVAGVLTSWRS
jgi:hypothetical protein